MNSMNLKDYRPDSAILDEKNQHLSDSDIQSSAYYEELNTLKIEKLSNRVTIISIIIPCLIGAILFYAYLDIKERVVDVDQTKQSQVEMISQQTEERINALEVKIAKNRFDLDSTIPKFDQKLAAIEGQTAKLAAGKADAKAFEDQLAKMEKRILDDAAQQKTTVQVLEKMTRETAASIKDVQAQSDKYVQQVKKDTALFKEEFDAKLLALSNYEQQIGELRKNLSLLDKKYNRIEQESLSRTKFDEKIQQLKSELTRHLSTLDSQVAELTQRMNTQISRLQKDVDLLMKSTSRQTAPSPATVVKPKPQVNIEPPSPTVIQQVPLSN